MSVDCVSSADNRPWEMITAESVANAKPAIVFMNALLVPDFMAATRSAKFAELLRGFDVAPGPAGNVFLFVQGQLPFDLCGRAKHERAGRNFYPKRDERVCADD